jgi:hypothetical protein
MDIAGFSDRGKWSERSARAKRCARVLNILITLNFAPLGKTPARLPKYEQRNERSHGAGFRRDLRESPDKSFIKMI